MLICRNLKTERTSASCNRRKEIQSELLASDSLRAAARKPPLALCDSPFVSISGGVPGLPVSLYPKKLGHWRAPRPPSLTAPRSRGRNEPSAGRRDENRGSVFTVSTVRRGAVVSAVDGLLDAPAFSRGSEAQEAGLAPLLTRLCGLQACVPVPGRKLQKHVVGCEQWLATDLGDLILLPPLSKGM